MTRAIIICVLISRNDEWQRYCEDHLPESSWYFKEIT